MNAASEEFAEMVDASTQRAATDVNAMKVLCYQKMAVTAQVNIYLLPFFILKQTSFLLVKYQCK